MSSVERAIKIVVLVCLLVLCRPIAAATYHISPTGNDSYAGTSAAPWASPNHALNCGDIIVAQAGSYNYANFASGKWGTVSCPAANNVAWLQCAIFDGCYISAGPNYGIYVDHSFWGVTGWEASTSSTGFTCFAAAPPSSNPTATIHHIIFVNNVANGCGGGGLGTFASGKYGVDYIAIISNIAFNSALNPRNCYSGISIFEPQASDSIAGTHIYVADNFVFGNVDPPVCANGPSTDGDGIIFDTFDHFLYCQQAVAQNNFVLANGGHGLEIQTYTTNPSCRPTVYFKNNTDWGNLLNLQFSTAWCVEAGINEAYGVDFTGNIVQPQRAAGCPSTNAVYAMYAYNTSGSTTGAGPASSIANNFIGLFTGAINTGSFNSDTNTFSFGVNITGLPGFANPVAPGQPACGGTANVLACMSPLISDFTPSGSAAAYGYQRPSATCITDDLYPQWLNSTSLPPGLVTAGCAPKPPTPVQLLVAVS